MKDSKHYVLIGSFKDGAPKGPEFKALLDAHHAYLKPYFDDGKILVSGPKAAGGGGVILIKLDDGEDINDFCAADPFVINGVQEYEITEFKVFEIQENAGGWR